MEPKTLLTADYLDIIFDKRNKSYGGYELRRHYNNRLLKGCAFLLLGVGAFACFSFVSSSHNAISGKPRTDTIALTNLQPREIEKPPKPIEIMPPPPSQPKQVHTVALTEPVITTDPIPDDRQMAHNDDLHNAAVGANNSDGPPSDVGIIPSTGNSGPGTGVVTPLPRKDTMTVVDQMPVFPGDMNSYLGSHMHYPEAARSASISGRVGVRFVVNEDGSISNVSVARPIGGGCDEEAIRVVSGMPKWKPGRLNGVPVKVWFSLPVSFVLQ